MLKHNEPMASHCSLRSGGLAQDFFTPNSIQALADFLSTNTQAVVFVGLGSNLLIRDQGFNGVVVKLTQLNALSINHSTISVSAGTTLAKLSRFIHSQHQYGGEFLSAIPGTVGGALAMNAGAFGSEFWQYVVQVQTMNSSGEVFWRSVDEFNISYRQVTPKHADEFFVAAKLAFNTEKSDQDVKQLLLKRNASQPIGLPSCGSVFKNPPGQYAAELIELANLKGHCVGGACVSNKHANFIINQNKATASDIENLITHIQQTVKSKFNINLETELIII
ncbi:MAG: UDP-N-acetylmuramate dehydrogenase [Candidatus Thioglobus sp.]|nr:UDP-N-acetylmuramate dehydrogenase [Candidatus Thioglobus pontius]MBL6976474.1 UDP-N-acetylmuramate dehydrogenase [Candidatus Thioglobus sp.]MBL6984089.1 UDP-N-acetylmuramate dehydrogenase [Candidatus Thioglobus sp.]